MAICIHKEGMLNYPYNCTTITVNDVIDSSYKLGTFGVVIVLFASTGRNKVAACAKHFVGDGGTTKGKNEQNTLTDMHGLLHIHMPAYYDSIIKGVSTIMVSYSSWNGEKMHANRNLISGYLKDKLKFKVNVTCSKSMFVIFTSSESRN